MQLFVFPNAGTLFLKASTRILRFGILLNNIVHEKLLLSLHKRIEFPREEFRESHNSHARPWEKTWARNGQFLQPFYLLPTSMSQVPQQIPSDRVTQFLPHFSHVSPVLP